MKYPTAILKNTKTGRFHPISYRPAPMPGNVDMHRWKSIGHHTEGFETLELAQAFIESKKEPDDEGNCLYDMKQIYDWDGDEIPASVIFYKMPEEATTH